jgi:hypothetical protein
MRGKYGNRWIAGPHALSLDEILKKNIKVRNNAGPLNKNDKVALNNAMLKLLKQESKL